MVAVGAQNLESVDVSFLFIVVRERRSDGTRILLNTPIRKKGDVNPDGVRERRSEDARIR